MKPGFGLVVLAADKCASPSSRCVTPPVALREYPCSSRALAEQPLQVSSHLQHCEAEMQLEQGQGDVG